MQAKKPIGDSKSTSQKLSDTTRSGEQSGQESGKGLMESAQDVTASAKDTVSKALGGIQLPFLPFLLPLHSMVLASSSPVCSKIIKGLANTRGDISGQ